MEPGPPQDSRAQQKTNEDPWRISGVEICRKMNRHIFTESLLHAGCYKELGKWKLKNKQKRRKQSKCPLMDG